MVDDINCRIFLKWASDDMQGLYYSLTHNFGCVAKTKTDKVPKQLVAPGDGLHTAAQSVEQANQLIRKYAYMFT